MTNNQIMIDELIEDLKPIDELDYTHIEARYRNVQMILTVLGYLLLAVVALSFLLLDDRIWFEAVEFVIAIAMTLNLIILRKAWECKGYALRENDITYRSGVVFHKTTTIPYNRLQQVSIKQNPVSKMFRLYAVEIVNGAQGLASLTIPGLTEEKANQIKGILIERLRNDQD